MHSAEFRPVMQLENNLFVALEFTRPFIDSAY